MPTTDKFKFTRAEAAEWIGNAQLVTFHAHVSMDYAIVGTDEGIFGGCRTTVRLTREAALHLVKGYLSDFSESHGHRIPCSVYRDGDYVAYWIG